MSEHFPVLIVVSPLLVAFITAALGWLAPRATFWTALGGVGIAGVSAWGVLYRVATSGPLEYRLGGWAPPWGIVYEVDGLNALVLVAVTSVAFLGLISGKKAIEHDYGDRLGAFYGLFLLSLTGLVGISVTGDAFNLYVLLEVASLTGYALIGLGPGRAPLASLNYVYLGTIGASFYLLGIGYLYTITGSLNMADIARLLPPLYGSRTLLAAFSIAMVGLWLKMALFPLHAWLPRAYSLAPSPAAVLLAPLVTKVMIYVMIRLMFNVFTPAYVWGEAGVSQLVVWLAVAAIVAGAFMALAERDFKRMLTYIIVAEVGYMVGGAWIGNRLALTGAILHIINDAAMTLCVFLAAANLSFKLGGTGFPSLEGLFKKMPWTMGALVVGAMSIIGVPPTCGFFSKWYLLRGAMAGGQYLFAAALIFSSLVCVVLFFRIFEIAYYEPLGHGHGEAGAAHGEGQPHDAGAVAVAEAPALMVLPLWVAAASLVALGLLTARLVGGFIDPAIPAVIH
ncbi:MAG: monovalent cation/H+ antiporter subunit D family protein [Deltaproteobacteria bacterium]|nr:monovalent cation/H+ antiporter subunit D family protein [Deltaproteobacteria bacterium]